MRWVFVPKSVPGDFWFTIGVFEVDLRFWCRWFIWIMAVAGVSFKCVLISSSVSPGQVIICPSLTTYNIVDFVALNRALCN
jgi:hypothetical protein